MAAEHTMHTTASDKGGQRRPGVSSILRLIEAQLSLSRGATAVLFGLVVALIAVDVGLLRQNAAMKRVVERNQRSLLPTVGSSAPTLLGIDMKGELRRIGYGQDRRETLLFVFSPDCSFSTREWPRWLDIVRQADPTKTRLIYANIGTSVPPDHLARSAGLNPEDVLETDASSKVAYNLQLTPQIVKISADGRIQKVWAGALQPEEELEVRLALRPAAQSARVAQ